MSFLDELFGGGDRTAADLEAQARQAKWAAALPNDQLPDFVQARLRESGAGRAPWISTMTPAELLLARSHGMRPIATVTGVCYYRFGYSWTNGHAEGWASALRRIREEALACGANAVVDVKMRTASAEESSMDFTLVGAAIRVEGLPPSPDPVIATVPALEFVRLLEMGIVPSGLAVGACYEWITDQFGSMDGGGFSNWRNQPLHGLSNFWESVRRRAHAALRSDAAAQGNGVLANTHFGQILKREQNGSPDAYLGRHIVIGTVVDVRPGDGVPHHIRAVVDMVDGRTPLDAPPAQRRQAYSVNDREGGI